ncbi:MAG: hemolysin III family protein [Vicinamibacterales bacterium]|nr:hemolysin III family protein [Vicinamibacterales bacterium]
MSHHRCQTVGEEIANSVTHGAGLVAAIVGFVAMVVAALTRGDIWVTIACVVYGTTLVLLYLSSTLYHALARTRAREVLRRIDHSAIYLLIAGTYTPFVLVSLRGPWGWSLFGVSWGLAVIGIVVKAVLGQRWPAISTTVYILMGWLVIVAVGPLFRHVPGGAIAWLFAGGLAYTGGVVFFAWERLRYSHAIWHLFVLTGSVCHYVAVMGYIV